MKVLLAADIFPPQTGGPATYVLILANELAKRGDGVKVVSLNPKAEIPFGYDRVSGNMYHVSKKNKTLRYLQYLWLLFIHAKGVDVIYAMGPVNAGLPALIASRLRRKPLVTKIVGDYAWEQATQCYEIKELIADFQKAKGLPWKVRLLRGVERYIARHSTVVVVPSCYLKNLVTGWGLSWHRVCVVYNAVDWRVVDRLERPVHEFCIVSVGRLVPWKGMDTLIGLMPEILQKYPKTQLRIIGDGPLKEKLEKQIKNLDISKKVYLLGELNRLSVMSEIKAAHVFVLNSGYEGLSHVLLEAVEANTPVLASDVGGNTEVIERGKNGDLFVYNDKAAIKGKIFEVFAGRQFVWKEEEKQKFNKRFSLNNMIEETRCILENVCRKS